MDGIEEFVLYEDIFEKKKETTAAKRQKIESLSLEEQEKQAFDRIMHIAAKREISSLKMIEKLKSIGYHETAIGGAINRAFSISAIDDRRYCECLVRTTISMGKGLRFVKQEILSLGIDPEELESYREYMESGEQERLSAALKILMSHPPRSKNVRNSAYRKLISKGFDSDIASKASHIFCSQRDGSSLESEF